MKQLDLGGGQGYTQDWASGTGIVVGGTGGATTMSKKV